MDMYLMVGALYLPWMSGVPEECPGEGYQLLLIPEVAHLPQGGRLPLTGDRGGVTQGVN